MIRQYIDRLRADDRAVSEVLAFVLVFGIIFSSVGLVYIFGLGALGDAQTAEQDRNAERAFETLGNTFADLQMNRGQERMVELNPRGATMSMEDDDPTISIEGIEDPVEAQDDVGGAVHYTNDNTRLSYELGAVFRSDDGNSIMVREPEFVCRPDADRAVVSYVEVDPEGTTGLATSNPLQISGVHDGTTVHDPDSIDDEIEIEITIDDSEHADAWARYFDDQEGWDWDGTDLDDVESGDEVTATCTVDEEEGDVVVRGTEIGVNLQR